MQTTILETAYKPRRPHKKSRHGCLRCKQGRRKCDEVKPGCTRCTERNLPCEYAETTFKQSLAEGHKRGASLLHVDDLVRQYRGSAVTSFGHSIQSRESVSPMRGNSPMGGQIRGSSEETFAVPLPLVVRHASMLDSREQDLFSHYLSHTVYAIAYDREDLYALQTGIPSLASHSKPLMSSIIALAAVCRCYDILKSPEMHESRVGEIEELLALADQHHKTSLRQTQADIAHIVHYDFVLANAPLMVLYASASHCVRIKLATQVSTPRRLTTDIASSQPQWISLIRAAHLAYTGLLGAEPRQAGGYGTMDSPVSGLSPSPFGDIPMNGATVLGEDGPSRETRDFLLPIIVATSGPALERLRSWVGKFTSPQGLVANGVEGSQQPKAIYNDVELQSCSEALGILSQVMNDVLSDNSPSASLTPQSMTDSDLVPLSLLSEVSPWLRKYLACVTSASNSRQPLRRSIMAFLNRVPAEYLDIVKVALDNFLGREGLNDGQAIDLEVPQLDDISRVAMSIFAHWLVLVMLLDGVWWIGGIGAWELERVVSYMHYMSDSSPSVIEEDWWPESMLKIAREIKKQEVL